MIPLPVDYIGFVFARSKRQVTAHQAGELIEMLRQWPEGQRPQSAGVFVNPELDELVRITHEAPLDIIQLHGKESPEFCRQVREKLGVQVFKVISLSSNPQQSDTAAQLEMYKGTVDAFLLDTYDPLYGGGSGKTFAWDQIHAYHEWTAEHQIPLFVAGGLNPENVKSLLSGYPLEGIDVSSGVETDGIKDIAKIKSFVERARA
ncbi:N-(5'-phosphoribosyl)anthranilate isomerase [Paenibacillus bovis]|uniref:N-(5'-phosphoribosyl)anthranilate isomerase n=2 Tax=Paenibacillus bovis TaxID=1616788 RepID=A0A172ZMR5_9BACL|nr:phosphoribosylanthranilate isomerase [Paenibacillus bovis]ANF98868.1 N-(5'-phosphoribosyl)anthranilate isomerase [Paenibacillus bovis]